jgi:hypothetical protein
VRVSGVVQGLAVGVRHKMEFKTGMEESSELLWHGAPIKVLHPENKRFLACWSCGRKTISVHHITPSGITQTACKWCGARL